MKAGQSRRMSIAESIANVLVGYGVAVATQMIVFPWFGIHVQARAQLGIGVIFTVVSLARSYVLRRAFNWFHTHRAQARAGGPEGARRGVAEAA